MSWLRHSKTPKNYWVIHFSISLRLNTTLLKGSIWIFTNGLCTGYEKVNFISCAKLSFCCAKPYRITCLHPGRNCVLCSTIETVCSIACATYVLLNKNARRYCATSIMHTIYTWWVRAYKASKRMHDSRRNQPARLNNQHASTKGKSLQNYSEGLFHIYMHVEYGLFHVYKP